MTRAPTQTSRDWLNSAQTSLPAWWLPHAAILAGMFVPVTIRAAIWITALIWMGTACILNSRRCNRTHCRYTGPYYLAMIAPVVALGFGVVSAGIYGWISLGMFIAGGSGLIWWATERTWGKFS
jgi:protein-S-isoprenylcysteine O-methyltransferase Ste14